MAAPDGQCHDREQGRRQVDDRPGVQIRGVVGAGEHDRCHRDEAEPDENGGFREPTGK